MKVSQYGGGLGPFSGPSNEPHDDYPLAEPQPAPLPALTREELKKFREPLTWKNVGEIGICLVVGAFLGAIIAGIFGLSLTLAWIVGLSGLIIFIFSAVMQHFLPKIKKK